MTPEEFLNQNGPPTYRVVTVNATGDVLCGYHPKRYLLAFAGDGVAVNCRPIGSAPGTTISFQFSNITTNWISHTLYGTLVNAGWEVVNPVPGAIVLVIEGFIGAARGVTIGQDSLNPMPGGSVSLINELAR